MDIFDKVFNKYQGPNGLHHLTGIPRTTLYGLQNGHGTSYSMRLLFHLLLIAPKGIIVAAAKRIKK